MPIDPLHPRPSCSTTAGAPAREPDPRSASRRAVPLTPLALAAADPPALAAADAA